MARPKKRRTIGDNPLDAVIPRASSRDAAAEEAPAKERMTFHLPREVTQRLKNAVFWTPGLSLTDLAARALTEAVDRLEKKQGKPFAQRKAELVGGRPMKMK